MYVVFLVDGDTYEFAAWDKCLDRCKEWVNKNKAAYEDERSKLRIFEAKELQ